MCVTTAATILSALFVPKRWAQWVGELVLFVLGLTFPIVFERQLA